MRIVAGALRGRKLVAPKGHSTRPTADRTRQALFDVLEHAPWSPGPAGARVIDLFAGSGALGLEAISRGAAFALFVDNDRPAREAVACNIDALGLATRTRILALDAARLKGRSAIDGEPFDLAFLDPPYGLGLAEAGLAALASGGWLTEGAVVIVERGEPEGALVAPAYGVVDERTWGAARVSVLRAAGAPSPRASARRPS
ncbi:MAG TPA: 16S rRNA (guanine(966)-N(2))-methyltransferase RsmD [Caulobacteraceae bacterium]